jgi:hypothetical protein
MGFTYPPVISDSSLYNPRFYPSLGADGTLTYEYAQTLYLNKNDFRLSYLSGVIPGSATSGSAIVLDETLSLSGLGSISCSALTVGGVAVGTLPTFLTGITPGAAENNKALVLDGSGAIGTISSLNATTYKQGGVIYDLSLVNRLSLNTLGTAEASKALVLDSTSSARGVVSLEINQTAALSTSSTMDAFGLILRRSSAAIGDTSGIALGVTNVSSISTTGGASIIFTRAGSQGIGTLSINLRTSSSAASTPLSKVLEFNSDGSSTFAYAVSAPSITLSTGGTGLQIPNLKFYNSTTASYDNFNHDYYLDVVEGGAVAQKALVVDINKDIGSIRDLDAVNLNASTKVSGTLGDFGSLSVGSTSIITSTRHIQNIGNITNSGTMNAGAGYQLNGATLVDSSQNIYGSSIIADYAQLDKAAGTVYSSTSKSNEYNLVLSQASNTSGTYSGMAFHVDTSGLSLSTPGACIISERDSTTAYDGSSISFYTKGAAGAATAPTKRMTISKTGAINFGSGISSDGDLLLIKSASSPIFRFGSALSAKNCISLQWNYAGSAFDTNRLSFDIYGTSNLLSLNANRRVCINGDAPTSQFHVVSTGDNMFATNWERVTEYWGSSGVKAGVIIYKEAGGSNANGVSWGTYTNDPLKWFINGTNCMELNTSKRLNINRSTGPEATLHAGGMIWADELFHSKQNVDGKCVYRTNWSQSNYLGMGTDATVGAMRLGTCDANFNWVSYAPVRGGAYTNASDRRIKRDIIDIPYGLAEVLRMQPRKFAMRNDGSEHVGFIAQEMLEVIPEVVSVGVNDELNEQGEPINPMGIDLASLVSVLCKAVQELKKELEILEKDRIDVHARLDELSFTT